MKDTLSTPSHHKLIVDIFASKYHSFQNRRGNNMLKIQKMTPLDAVTSARHSCYEELYHLNPMTRQLDSLSKLLGHFKKYLPQLIPQKYTLEAGLIPSWRSMLPRRNFMTSSGLLAIMLVIASATVWALPQEAPIDHIVKQQPKFSSPTAAHTARIIGNDSALTAAESQPVPSSPRLSSYGSSETFNSNSLSSPSSVDTFTNAIAAPTIDTTIPAETPLPPTVPSQPTEPDLPPAVPPTPPADTPVPPSDPSTSVTPPTPVIP